MMMTLVWKDSRRKKEEKISLLPPNGDKVLVTMVTYIFDVLLDLFQK